MQIETLITGDHGFIAIHKTPNNTFTIIVGGLTGNEDPDYEDSSMIVELSKEDVKIIITQFLRCINE